MIQKKKSPIFLSGGGDMGERTRNFDWKNTSIGVPENWSPALQNLLSLMLANRFPMILWWGKDYIQFYNDAYIPISGLKHPDNVLGKQAKDCWQEIWHVIGPLIDTPYNGGEPTWLDNILLQLHRKNFTEETYFTAAYSPVPDSTALNGIGGVLANVHEITNQVINQRALETLQKISSYSLASNSVNSVYENALLALSENKKDFPFAIIYKIDAAGNTAQLCATAGIDKTHPEIEPINNLDLRSNTVNIKNITRAIEENTIVHIVNDGRWKDFPKGYWDIMPNEYVHVPIKNLNKNYPHAILTIGLNPYRKFDDSYRNFVNLVSEQISQGVNNALAYETERKRVEEMEALDKAKTVFFSNISHEFRTPLTLILGPLEELLTKATINGEDKQHLETTHRNAMRLLRLVNSLLDFSRIESGRQQGAYVLTDISEYTIKLASNFRSLIEKSGLKLIVNADEAIQPVYVDRQMWEKIVFNLLSNAFKYTLVGEITVSLSTKDNTAVLKINDTGLGIPQNELPKMFDRFHRVANAVGRSYEGTGIGLSLVKELVNLHGGSINVQSNEGKGSTFTVTIPFGKAHLPETKIKESEDVYPDSILETYAADFATLIDPNAAPQINGEQTSLSNELILIVDDNADMRQHLQSVIGAKYKTMLAIDGMDALDKINEHKPSLVLSDIMMPVMDGVQLLEEIKQNPKTENIPVIFLTARAGEEPKIEGYQTGADDYLVKPFSSKELIARIDSQIRTKNQREDARKKSEHSDAQLRNFVKHAPVAICLLSGSNYVVEVANTKMFELWGKTADQLMNKPIFEAMPDAAAQGFEELLNGVYETGISFFGNEVPLNLVRNGVPQEIVVNFVYEPLYKENKNISGIIVVANEVTEQVNARIKIEESEERFRSLVQTLPQLVWGTDAQGNVEFASFRWKEYSGMESGGEKAWRAIVHPDDYEGITAAWGNSLLTGNIYNFDVRLKNKNGEYRWHSVKGVPVLDKENNIVKWVGAFTDIQEQKIREEKKDEFISIASHEMKTPVSTAKAYLQMLELSLDEKNEEACLYTKKASQSVERLNELIGELLDVSKIRIGKLNFKNTTFNFNDMINTTVEDIQLTSSTHVIIKICKACNEVCGDKERLQQVVVNLLNNAIKYSPSADKVVISMEQQIDTIQVSVKDFGIGIAQHSLGKIFDKYHRIEEHAVHFQGLGIGLFISHEIIQRHHGKLWAESESGVGSTFYFTIPLNNKVNE